MFSQIASSLASSHLSSSSTSGSNAETVLAIKYTKSQLILNDVSGKMDKYTITFYYIPDHKLLFNDFNSSVGEFVEPDKFHIPNVHFKVQISKEIVDMILNAVTRQTEADQAKQLLNSNAKYLDLLGKPAGTGRQFAPNK